MSWSEAVELLSTGHGLLEGPVWDPARGLLVADAIGGGVWCLAAGELPRIVVPHRRGIGGMALHAAGGLVVSGRNVAFKSLSAGASEGETVVILGNDAAAGIVGFNDLTTDAAGRVYVGSLGFVPMHGREGEGRPGNLHLVELDGSARIVVPDVLLTNGLGFSPDGKRLYHSDSLRRTVYLYDVGGDGSLGGRRPFATISTGLPDGLAVAADGSVWVALAHGSCVAAFAPDGREIARIPVRVPMVTSLCFGGSDLRDLFIVTGSEGSPSDLGACIFGTRSQVPGLPRPLARVALPRRGGTHR